MLKYANLNYQGTQLAAPTDVSAYDTLHLDFWTADSSALSIYLINSAGPVETEYVLDVTTKGTWVSVDIPLSAFAPVDLTIVDQIKVVGNGTIYFDNWYFTCEGGCGNSPSSVAAAPEVPAENVVSLFSDTYEDLAGTNTDPSWDQQTDSTVETIAGESVLKYANLNYQGTQLAAPTDVSAYDTLHLDFWTADSSALSIYLINSAGPVETEYVLDVTTKGTWVSVDIPLSEFAPVDLTIVDQIKVVGNGTVFFDNWYFCKECAKAPAAVAAAPTADAGSVLSIFSDTYEDLAGTNTDPSWDQQTDSTVETIAGESVLKYANLNYQGTQLAAPIDVSAYDTLHLDFWTADSSALSIYLINSAGPVETEYVLDVSTKRAWVSVDIPLTEFAPVDLTIVDQIKVVGNGTIYFDNWYFE